MSDDSPDKKAKIIIKILELAEEIDWKTLAIAKDMDQIDPEGILIGTSEFIEGFKQEMVQSLNEEITDEFLKLESSSSDDGGDDDGGSGDTFH